MEAKMKNISIRCVSERFVRPNKTVEESKKRFDLGVSGLSQISMCHLQAGLLFNKLPSMEEGGMDIFLRKLQQSLSSTLVHFYPLAGQLVTEIDSNKHELVIFVDCNKGPGAKLVHAALDNVSVNDIILPTHVPTNIIQYCFTLGKIPTNYDDHEHPILVAQVTELTDGIFFGISVNHCVVDGASFWNFLSSWSEIFQTDTTTLTRTPSYTLWCPKSHVPIVKIPHTHPDEFIKRYEPKNGNNIREIILQFSPDSIARLRECGEITLFQAVAALIWRAIIRARGSRIEMGSEEISPCMIIANIRSRVDPPLPRETFGSFILPCFVLLRVGDLLRKELRWVAKALGESVRGIGNEYVEEMMDGWVKAPDFPSGESEMDQKRIVISGSHREDSYGVDFGLGRAVAVRRGSNMYDGKVVFFPARDDGNGVCVEVYLLAETMKVFQRDEELLSFVS